MSRKLNGTFPIVILMGLASLATPALAGVHQLWDEAHFVKAQTIEQVDQILDQIHTRFGKDLMIETFPSVPDDYKPKMEKDGKDKFYAGWTVADAIDLKVNGVMILVTGDPPHLQIEVGNQTRAQAFTLADRDELVQKMGEAFHAKDFDGGMVMAAQFVRDRMARNLAGGAAPPTPAARPTTQPATTSGDGFGEPAAPAKHGF